MLLHAPTIKKTFNKSEKNVSISFIYFPQHTLIELFCFPFLFSGQRILHHKSSVLETVVLINPSDEAVSTEVSTFHSNTPGLRSVGHIVAKGFAKEPNKICCY